MVIGERVPGDGDAERSERGEEACGWPMPATACSRSAAKLVDCSRLMRRAAHSPEPGGLEPHRERAGTAPPAIDHGRVDLPRRRLAQRSGRQQQAVAEAALVLDRDLEVAREP